MTRPDGDVASFSSGGDLSRTCIATDPTPQAGGNFLSRWQPKPAWITPPPGRNEVGIGGKAQIWKRLQQTANQLPKVPAPFFRVAKKAGNIVYRMRAHDDWKPARHRTAGGAYRFFHSRSPREGRFKRDVSLENDHCARRRNPAPTDHLRRFETKEAPDSKCRLVGTVSGCTGRYRLPPERSSEKANSCFDPAPLIRFGQKAFIFTQAFHEREIALRRQRRQIRHAMTGKPPHPIAASGGFRQQFHHR